MFPVGAEVNGLDNVRNLSAKSVGDGKTLIEPPVSSTDDSLRLLLAGGTAQSVSDGDARRPVILVVDAVLSFPAQAIAESETRVELPVVLIEKGAVEKDRVSDRIGGVGEAVLLRRAGRGRWILVAADEGLEVGEDVGTVAAAGAQVGVVV